MSKKQMNHGGVFGLVFLGALLLLSGCASVSNPDAKMLSHAAKTGAGGAAQVQGVKLSYRLASERLTLREPVILSFTASNESGQARSLDLGQDRKANFLFTVKLPDGKTIQLPQLRREGISVPGQVSLEPGQVYTQRLLLNEWYEFSEPGAYEITARLVTSQAANSSDAASDSPEFRARLEIAPLDKGRLKETCSSLLKQITGAGSYSDAAEAALALSYVKDPVAIPFLEKALSSGKMVEPVAISGLERIDGQEAERVLAATAEAGQDEDVKELSKAALERLKMRRGGKAKPSPSNM
ncbi:MAG TPA: HEAT repeat domain-containing protein [Pyrinomonadaceae bacterium]|nr:HEAT repeat domain-containing protein [Pyrinomonadaceae bacterium]